MKRQKLSNPKRLVILTKVPLFGTIKTRLARDVGQVQALCFARTISQRLYREVSNDKRWDCQLAITPDTLVNRTRIWPARSKQIPQGQGDLGERMANVAAAHSTGPLVIIGTDIPGIKKTHIAQAFKTLGYSDFVIGPAKDGGYWLIGMKKRPAGSVPFKNIRWSTKDTLKETVANIGKRMRISFLEELEDIDDGLSWKRWKDSLNASRIPG